MRYELAKSKLNIIDVAIWLGLDVKGDVAPCPFHNERSQGAFRFNVKEQFCHCFSCGESADCMQTMY